MSEKVQVPNVLIAADVTKMLKDYLYELLSIVMIVVHYVV